MVARSPVLEVSNWMSALTRSTTSASARLRISPDRTAFSGFSAFSMCGTTLSYHPSHHPQRRVDANSPPLTCDNEAILAFGSGWVNLSQHAAKSSEQNKECASASGGMADALA
ncbi:hypothetical protein RHCRD62_20455 [Rhodococcus sp. RD6.2]|nr:hypothetical protein RHCRD62_20455 [Rhodococcus sp. RD6.2]